MQLKFLVSHKTEKDHYIKLDVAIIFTDFRGLQIILYKYMIDSEFEAVFFSEEIWFPNRICTSNKKPNSVLFRQISAVITAFLVKVAAANLIINESSTMTENWRLVAD